MGILRGHLPAPPPIFTDMGPKRSAVAEESSLFPNARRAEPLASRMRNSWLADSAASRALEQELATSGIATTMAQATTPETIRVRVN